MVEPNSVMCNRHQMSMKVIHSIMHGQCWEKRTRTLKSSRLSSQSLQGSVGSVHVAGSLSALRRLPGRLPRLVALRTLPVSVMGMDLGGLSSSSRLLGLAAMKLSESTRSPCGSSLAFTFFAKLPSMLLCVCVPCMKMKAYWLIEDLWLGFNQLFRRHHLVGLLAMQTAIFCLDRSHRSQF